MLYCRPKVECIPNFTDSTQQWRFYDILAFYQLLFLSSVPDSSILIVLHCLLAWFRCYCGSYYSRRSLINLILKLLIPVFVFFFSVLIVWFLFWHITKIIPSFWLLEVLKFCYFWRLLQNLLWKSLILHEHPRVVAIFG